MKTKFTKAYDRRATRIKHSAGIKIKGKTKWNVYDVHEVIGKYKANYMRGRDRTRVIGTIAGTRGAWYVIVFDGSNNVIKNGPWPSRESAADGCKLRGKRGKSRRPRKPTRKHFGVRRGYGDDLYSWEVYDKRNERTVINGESKQQAGYLADKLEKEEVDRQATDRRAIEAENPALIAKVTSLSDLANKCRLDEPGYRDLAAATVENLACDHMRHGEGWQADVQALVAHTGSMVGEYGMDEDDAESGLVDEINFVRDCI